MREWRVRRVRVENTSCCEGSGTGMATPSAVWAASDAEPNDTECDRSSVGRVVVADVGANER